MDFWLKAQRHQLGGQVVHFGFGKLIVFKTAMEKQVTQCLVLVANEIGVHGNSFRWGLQLLCHRKKLYIDPVWFNDILKIMHMTSVTTKTYAIEKQAYFKLLTTLYMKKMWWITLIYFIVLAFALQWLTNGDTEVLYMTLIAVLVLSTGITLLSRWRFVNSNKNRAFYLTRHYVMDHDKVRSFVEDGSTSVTMINSYVKAEVMGQYYLLYLSKAHCTFIPASSFKTDEDRQWFETNVIGRIKKPGF